MRNTLFETKALHLQTSHKSLPYVAHKVTTSIQVSGIRSRSTVSYSQRFCVVAGNFSVICFDI